MVMSGFFSSCGWLWVVAGGCGWLRVVDGCGWLRMVVDGCGWLWMVVVAYFSITFSSRDVPGL